MRARVAATFCLCLGGVAWGGSQLEQSIAERTQAADRVVLAQILDTRVVVPDGDVRQMTTVTTLVIRESYKGAGPQTLEVVQLGGEWGLWSSRVAGDARFAPGETALLFLHCRDAQRPALCGLMGLADGRLSVTTTPAGQQVQTRHAVRSLESVVDDIRRALPAVRPLRRGRP